MPLNDIKAFDSDNGKTNQEPSEPTNDPNVAPLNDEPTCPPHEQDSPPSCSQDDDPKPKSIAKPATPEQKEAERQARNEASEQLTQALLDQDMSGDYWLSNEEFAIAFEAEIKEKGSGVEQVRAISANKIGKGPPSHGSDI